MACIGLMLVVGCADAGSDSDCDPDPPCELSGSTRIPLAVFSPTAQIYDVAVEASGGRVAFSCSVAADRTSVECAETERDGLELWSVSVGPDEAQPHTALVLELDRGDDDSPGPNGVRLDVRSELGIQITGLSPSAFEMGRNSRTCRECWFELPETLGD